MRLTEGSEIETLQKRIAELETEAVCPCCTKGVIFGRQCSECRGSGSIRLAYETARNYQKLAKDEADDLTRQLEEERARLKDEQSRADCATASLQIAPQGPPGNWCSDSFLKIYREWWVGRLAGTETAARNAAGRNALCECGDARWKHFTLGGRCEVCACEEFQKFDPRVDRQAAKEPRL